LVEKAINDFGIVLEISCQADVSIAWPAFLLAQKKSRHETIFSPNGTGLVWRFGWHRFSNSSQYFTCLR